MRGRSLFASRSAGLAPPPADHSRFWAAPPSRHSLLRRTEQAVAICFFGAASEDEALCGSASLSRPAGDSGAA
jgi:hypothetical protein